MTANLSHMNRRARFIVAGATCAMSAICALATLAAAEDNNKVDVHLRGFVGATCEVAGRSKVTTPVSIGNVNQPGSTYVEYPVNCNAPFGYEISSRYGGLRRTSRINGERPKRLYNVNVNIPTDDHHINDTCRSDTIEGDVITCALSDSGDGVALDQKARLTVSWEGAPQLDAGTYSDRLTFTVKLKH